MKGNDKVFILGGGWVKVEGFQVDEGKREELEVVEDVKFDMKKLEEVVLVEVIVVISEVMKEEQDVKLDVFVFFVFELVSGGSMFKK